MAKIVKRSPGLSLPTDQGPPRIRRRMLVYMKKAGMVAQSWPTGMKRPPTAAELEWRADFKRYAEAQKQVPAGQQIAARDIAANSKYTWRDVIARAMVGRLFDAPNYGEVIVQYNLDILGTDPGMIVIRTAEGWIALAIGDDGDVLTVDTGLPTWKPPSGGGGAAITTALLSMSGNKVISPNTWTNLNNWQTAGGYDPQGLFNPATPSRLTVPPNTTRAKATVGIGQSVSANLTVAIDKNGSGVYHGRTIKMEQTQWRILETPWLEVAPGDWFDVWVNSGSFQRTIVAGDTTFFGLACY